MLGPSKMAWWNNGVMVHGKKNVNHHSDTPESPYLVSNRSALKSFLISLVVILSLVVTSSSFAALGFEPWEDEVFVAIGKEYGPEAEKRFRRIMEIILANHDKPVLEKLKLTNDTLNNIPWIADPDLWKREDYWATPFETLATFGGDCEDIAFAKYGMLLMMGVPDNSMGFAYVENQGKERHMVLIYRENENSPVYVLDNEIPEVLTGPERRDLTAIYIFQNDGRLYIIGDDGKKRYVKQEFTGRRFEKWITGKERARENRKKYEKYNGNRPLFPDN
jgi:predicted transglutaminase-like cysteine proteinase